MIHLQNAEFVRSAAKKEDFPRDGLPQIVFSGRSNVGKSSVINRILNRKNFARVGNAPGKPLTSIISGSTASFIWWTFPGMDTPRCHRRRRPVGPG